VNEEGNGWEAVRPGGWEAMKGRCDDGVAS